MSNTNRSRKHSSNDPAIRRRDAGRALIKRVNRWLIAGAVLLTGGVTAAAAQAFHGHQRSGATVGRSASAGATAASATQATGHRTLGTHGAVNSRTDSLKPPAQAPSTSSAHSASVQPATATPAPAPVVSGGS